MDSGKYEFEIRRRGVSKQCYHAGEHDGYGRASDARSKVLDVGCGCDGRMDDTPGHHGKIAVGIKLGKSIRKIAIFGLEHRIAELETLRSSGRAHEVFELEGRLQACRSLLQRITGETLQPEAIGAGTK